MLYYGCGLIFSLHPYDMSILKHRKKKKLTLTVFSAHYTKEYRESFCCAALGSWTPKKCDNYPRPFYMYPPPLGNLLLTVTRTWVPLNNQEEEEFSQIIPVAMVFDDQPCFQSHDHSILSSTHTCHWSRNISFETCRYWFTAAVHGLFTLYFRLFSACSSFSETIKVGFLMVLLYVRHYSITRDYL